MFNEMYRVLAKVSGSRMFQGTGQTSDGAITIEPNVINQSFYSEIDANKIAESLISAGIDAKVVQGS